MTEKLRPVTVADILHLRPVLFPTHPRITKLRKGKGKRCEEYRWSQMSMKAAHDPGGLREKYRCKQTGLWEFKALSPSNAPYSIHARSGTYCFAHLLAQLNKPRENDSFTKWWKRKLAERGIDADTSRRYTSVEEMLADEA